MYHLLPYLFLLFCFQQAFSQALEGAYSHSYVTLANGLTLHYVEKGPIDPVGTVVLVHGFPDFWYTWRQQLTTLSSNNYRVIAYDQRGYGESDKPSYVGSYDVFSLSSDIILLLDALSIQKAHLVGHDWGSLVAWTAAKRFPHRFDSITALSVPYVANNPTTTEKMVSQFGEDFYINRFQAYGDAEELFNLDNVEPLFKLMFMTTRSNSEQPPLFSVWKAGIEHVKQFPQIAQPKDYFSETDLQYYVSTFKKGSFTFALNYYRNLNRNAVLLHQEAEDAYARTGVSEDGDGKDWSISIPSFYIGGTHDLGFLKAMAGPSKYLKDHEIVWLESGHFIQVEKGPEVSNLLISFFERVAKKQREKEEEEIEIVDL